MVTAEQARGLLALHGKVKSQPPEDWAGEFPLPMSAIDFYRDVGPMNVTIDVLGDAYFLPRLSKLWKFQDGYRFVGRKREREGSWDDDWLVVGDRGGDPLILSRSRGVVSLAGHGAGAWEPEELFPCLTAMVACLAAAGEHAAGGNDRVQEALTPLLGQPAAVSRVLNVLGI